MTKIASPSSHVKAPHEKPIGRCRSRLRRIRQLRYHNKYCSLVSQGRVESTVRHRKGVGVRVLVDGTWGFASTSDCSAGAIRKTVETASASAKSSASFRKSKIARLPAEGLAVGDFAEPGVEEVLARPMAEKLQIAIDTEAKAREASSLIQTASCGYNEIFTEKAIVTSDGASAAFKLIRPEFRVSAVAERDGSMSTGFESIGVTGGWDCLFRDPAQMMVDKAARTCSGFVERHHSRRRKEHCDPIPFHRRADGARKRSDTPSRPISS